jgi:hexosaminidase
MQRLHNQLSLFYWVIDTPSHTTIIGTSYPDYVACFDATPWSKYANELRVGQLRFALLEVMNFTASLLADVAKTLFIPLQHWKQ